MIMLSEARGELRRLYQTGRKMKPEIKHGMLHG